MNDLEQTKRDYIRAREILQIVSDGDNQSMEATILKKTWDIISIGKLQDLINWWEDMGVHLTIRKAD